MDIVARQNLTDFGQYVAECMPKYVQKVQLTAGDELEILIAPEGVLPVLTFLKDHHNAQFASLADICGLDMPTREFRFEVMLSIIQLCFIIVKFIRPPLSLINMPIFNVHLFYFRLFIIYCLCDTTLVFE